MGRPPAAGASVLAEIVEDAGVGALVDGSRTSDRAGRRRLAVLRLLNSHRGWDAAVRSVVALNPWVYRSDDAEVVAARLRRHTEVEELAVEGKHAMLRHGAAFEQAAARFTVAHLLH